MVLNSRSPLTERHIGLLLLPNFTMLAFSSVLEPLRMANYLANRRLYRWTTLAEHSLTVPTSSGVSVVADRHIGETADFDIVIVCGGVDVHQYCSQGAIKWLSQLAAMQVTLGGVCTGSYLLAKAGLLDGYTCTIHWEYLASWAEGFPKLQSSNKLFCIDRDRLTSSGGTAPVDMMLNVIESTHGRELSASISNMFAYDRIRDGFEQQKTPLKHLLGSSKPKLMEAVTLMEANIEEPIGLNELSDYVCLSRRQLERLFQKYLKFSPSRYYLNLRLMRARELLKKTDMSIIEIATACGFISTPHFSKCYRNFYKVSPREERTVVRKEFSESINGVSVDVCRG